MPENLSSVVCEQQGADQHVHLHSLISAFDICFLESSISKLATSKFSLFYLVSVAEQAGFGMAYSENPKTGFLSSRHISFSII